MQTIDFTPLFRHTIGFDNVQRIFDSIHRLDDSSLAYPPYNIEAVGEDAYRLTMAVAGFGEEDLDVIVKENALVISGARGEEDAETAYLHRGIASRAFERRFKLADHIRITGAALENGLLHVELAREVPEDMKPRKIAIASKAPPATKALGRKAA